jgi:hypothetical protein
MTTKLRFRDLQVRGIARSWAQLKRLQELYGFPKGRLLSPNCRVWDDEEELNPWLESRPVDGTPLRGAAKAKKARKAAGAQSEAGA